MAIYWFSKTENVQFRLSLSHHVEVSKVHFNAKSQRREVHYFVTWDLFLQHCFALSGLYR